MLLQGVLEDGGATGRSGSRPETRRIVKRPPQHLPGSRRRPIAVRGIDAEGRRTVKSEQTIRTPRETFVVPAVPKPFLTPQEYLARERQAETKSEYLRGEVFAMAGASREHNLIAGNVNRELGQQLRERECEVYQADMRVKVSPTGLYTYPDVTVVCGEPEFEDAKVDTLLNPRVLVEVLSPSTADYDRGGKFTHYRRLSSLQEYILISQDRPLVEHYVRRGPDEWLLTEQRPLQDTLVLPSIECQLPLTEIYLKVQFASEAGEPPVPQQPANP
jgi:Uma2 family endonuclease